MHAVQREGLGEGCVLNRYAIHGRFEGSVLYAKPGRQVRLRIEVDQKHPVSGPGQLIPDVAREACFARPARVIEEGQRFHPLTLAFWLTGKRVEGTGGWHRRGQLCSTACAVKRFISEASLGPLAHAGQGCGKLPSGSDLTGWPPGVFPVISQPSGRFHTRPRAPVR